MRELAEGLMKVLMIFSIGITLGMGFGIGVIAAFKIGGPIHIEQTTTVRNVKQP